MIEISVSVVIHLLVSNYVKHYIDQAVKTSQAFVFNLKPRVCNAIKSRRIFFPGNDIIKNERVLKKGHFFFKF